MRMSLHHSERPRDAEGPADGAGDSLDHRIVCSVIVSETPAHNSRVLKVAHAVDAAGGTPVLVYSGSSDDDPPPGFEVTWVRRHAADSEIRVWPVRVAQNLFIEFVRNPLAMARAAWEFDADIYHAHFLTALLPAWIAARLRGARLVYDVRDLLIDTQLHKWPGWKIGYYRWLERFLARRADAVIAVSRPMARVLESRFGLDHVETIIHGPTECRVSEPVSSSPVRLFFQGAFRRNRNLEDLVRAMVHLRGLATLTLQGWGEMEESLRALVSELGVGDIVAFIPPCDPGGVVEEASHHDVGVICYRGETLNLVTTTPNKLYDYIAGGLAIAASDLEGLQTVIGEFGCGVAIDPSSSESIAHGLIELVSDPSRVVAMKRAAGRACPRLTWAVQSKKLVACYVDLLDPAGSHNVSHSLAKDR